MFQHASASDPLPSPRLLLVTGGLLVGTLDAIFAISFWRIGYGTAPSRIFQSVAAGLLGRASFDGGWTTVWLGAALHYGIASAIVVVYYLASLRLSVLVEQPVRYGVIYGVAVYAVMNYVVIPLSAALPTRFNAAWVISSVVVHALFIGVPSALFSRWALIRS
jgi:hypothetical protein